VSDVYYCTGGALSGKYLDMKSAPSTSRMREYVGFMHRYSTQFYADIRACRI
jgi:hypothetical protein